MMRGVWGVGFGNATMAFDPRADAARCADWMAYRVRQPTGLMRGAPDLRGFQDPIPQNLV
ncbi:MAG: hypothetical protein CMJ18_23725 [Phycisphaeraceae bacterium]|nr:hypothetical protein [Phycisphaeraceae bacterium]